MKDIEKTKAELLTEIQTLRERLTSSEETLRSIHQGEVDAFVISTPQGARIFTLQSADQSYRLLIEEMQQSAVILSIEGLILYCNKSFSDLLKKPLEQLIGSYFKHFLSPQEIPLFQSQIQQAQRGQRNAMELFMTPSNAVEIPVYLSVNALKLDDVSMSCVVITDLTEQKRHERTLASEKLAHLMLERAGEAILVCDQTGTIIRASQVAYQLWGEDLLSKSFDTLHIVSLLPSQPNSKIGQKEQLDPIRFDVFPHNKAPFAIASVLGGDSFQGLEVEVESQGGQVLNLILNARPLADVDNQFRGAVVILTDITRRKQAETALQQSQLQLQRQLAEIEAIYQCAPVGLSVLDADLRFVRINQRLAEINGIPVEAHIGHTMRELLPDLADATEQRLRPVLKTGNPCLSVEISGCTPAQPGVQRTWLESFLPLNDGDRIIGINIVCEEITDHKRIETERQKAEEFLRQAKEELEIRVAERTSMLHQTIFELQTAEAHITASLQEKEVLLKEIHHRVKNNLGIVSSLLQLQIRRTHDPQTTIILQDSQNRIASIALVHEKLYRSENLSDIDCSQYIQDLTVYLFDSYNISTNQIKLNIQAEKGRLDIETVIPCGLVINELVSNALKHAFPDDRQGEILVRFTQASEPADARHRQVSTLIIQDNGIGLPDSFDIKTTKTLGLTLVQGLVKQMGATVEIKRHPGTTFTITLVKRNHDSGEHRNSTMR